MSHPPLPDDEPVPVYVPLPGQDHEVPQAADRLQSIVAGQNINNPPVNVREKRYAYIFLACTVAVLVLMIVDLNLYAWTDYCNIHVGLTEASTNGHRELISDIEEIICELSPLEYLSCGNICHNLRKFKVAGQVMLGLSVPAVVLLALTGARVALLLINPSRRWSGTALMACTILQAILWTAATIVYIVLFAMVADDASSKTSVEGGMQLAIVAAFVTIANGFMGLYIAIKLFA